MNIISYTTNPFFLLLTTKSYLISLYLLQLFMKNKKPLVLKNPLIIYNIIQILLNIYMINGLSSLPSVFNIFGLNTSYNKNLEYYTYIHYLSKYLDYCDTWFIILRKKTEQLSFLHIYHHSSIGIVWGFLLYNKHGNGTGVFGCFINSIVHLFMYSHYLWTSLGYNNPFKKLITKMQITQFNLCLIHSIIVFFYETIFPYYYAWIQFIYQIQMIYLFSNFYIRKY